MSIAIDLVIKNISKTTIDEFSPAVKIATLTIMRFLLYLLAALLPAVPAAAGSEEGSTYVPDHQAGIYVVDGDTIHIQDTRYRLWGVEAPELDQVCRSGSTRESTYACGENSRIVLQTRIGGRAVECRPTGEHDLDYIVPARCSVEGEDLGAYMIEQGFAIQDREASRGNYDKQEEEARSNTRALWSDTFFRPEIWRQMTPEQKARF